RSRPLSGTIIFRKGTLDGRVGHGGSIWSFQVQVDPRGIGYLLSGEEASANFTLHIIVEDDSGRERVSAFHLINHAYPAELWRKGDVGPVLINGWVELPAGSFTLRALFRNTQSGAGGEVRQTLELPPSPA